MTELNELYHFGIKGQRWGVRRFQNADGTLTSDGRKRYRAYKKDWNSYNKLNRHVAASQKHLKEEGVLLDRMKDRYEASNRAYRKAMSKSSGFLGLKAGQKAQKVANAQLMMDKVGSDYKTAASSYGVAKKIASEDTDKLKKHVSNMIRNYGKGSINELRTETVKIGQNKLQKLLQGAPKSILLSNKRDTEEFIKTGKTLADLPVIGNLYTSNYIAKRELDLKKSEIERTENTSNYRTGQLKKNKDKSKQAGITVYDKPSYLDDTYYDKEKELDNREARKKLERERIKVEKRLSKQRIEEARKKAEESVEKVKSEPYKEAQDKKIAKIKEKEQKEIEKINKKAQEDIYYTRLNRSAKEKDRQAKEAAVKDAVKAPLLARQINKGSKKYAQEHRQGSTIKSKLAGAAISVIGAGATAAAGPIAGYAARVAIKKHKKKKQQEAWNNFWGIKHSATYRVVRSDELYHHGIKGQRWGVRRYQNSDGTLTAKGKARYGKQLEKEGGVYLKKGSMVQRVSDVDETPGGNPNGTKHMYVAFTDEDKFRYKMASRSLGGTKFTVETPLGYQIDLKVKDDILAPGLKTQVDTAIDHVKNMSMDEVKSKFIDKKGYMKSTLYDDPEDFVSDLMKNNGSDKISDFQKRAYLHYSRNLMKDKDLRDQFFKSLSDKGYNAVIDYNDVAKWGISGDGKPTVVKGFSDKPLIVFDSSKSLEKVGSHAITYDEMANDAKNLKKMYSNRSALKKFGGAAAATAAAVPTAFVSPMAATVIAMYGGMFGITIPGMKDSIKSTNYSYYEKAYRKYANMQKNDPVAYKKSVKNIIEAVNKSKEAEKEAEKKDKAEG